MTEQQKI